MDAVFVDSAVPMYLVGKPHENRDRLVAWLQANADEQLVTSAEVYQEIIHRYVAIDRREAIADAFTLLDTLVATVHAVTRDDLDEAHSLVRDHRGLSSRDALHAAVMRRHGVHRILTTDQDFDFVPRIARLP